MKEGHLALFFVRYESGISKKINGRSHCREPEIVFGRMENFS